MTVYNSIDKLGNRSVGELEDLNMVILETSFKVAETKVNMENTARDSSNMNYFEKIKNRTIEELQGLLISIVEDSNRKKNTTLEKIRVIKPIKTYKNKIKIIKKYDNKIKY